MENQQTQMEKGNPDIINTSVSIAEEKPKAKTYPVPGTQPDFVFENATEEAMGIETRSYDNGGKIKRTTLSDGRIAISRRLRGHQMVEASKVADGSEEKVRPAVAAQCTTVNEQPIVMEELLNMWGNDFNLIQYMSGQLNF